jgi:hypothetical protein
VEGDEWTSWRTGASWESCWIGKMMRMEGEVVGSSSTARLSLVAQPPVEGRPDWKSRTVKIISGFLSCFAVP